MERRKIDTQTKNHEERIEGLSNSISIIGSQVDEISLELANKLDKIITK